MTNNSEYNLVPAGDPGYYTREPDGISGMTVTALADFCGIDQPAITNLLNKIRDSDPITKDIEESLKPYAGKDWRLITNDSQGRLIIVDEVCQAVVEYYALDARSYKGKEVARDNFRVIAKAGMRLFIWSKTGYIPPQFRPKDNKPTRGAYWYKRIGLAMSDTVKPLQAGYFCVYVEMMRFFSELEMRLGYVVDDINLETDEHIVPDISIGKRFNSWLRDDSESASKARKEFLNSHHVIDFRPAANNKSGYRHAGANNGEVLIYNHIYPSESHGSNNIHFATSYPNRYKSIFHHYLEECYIPEHCFPYIKKRDPKGIEQIRQTLLLMPEKTKAALSNTLVGRFIKPLLLPGK
jgi:hypothetical protein